MAKNLALLNGNQNYQQIAEEWARGKMDANFGTYAVDNLLWLPILLVVLWMVIGIITYFFSKIMGGHATAAGYLDVELYSFMVPLVGGRRWTAISTASLLIPAIGIGYAVQDNTTSYPTMLTLALLCGLGGGNFSSSMANISFFFPKERKGSALGVNAGLGNLGVSVVQFLSPLVVTAGIRTS